MSALTDTRTQPLNEMEPAEVFHVEHRIPSETGEILELARYSVTDCGQRILSWQEVDGHVRVVDRPAGRGRSYLVERDLELDAPEAIADGLSTPGAEVRCHPDGDVGRSALPRRRRGMTSVREHEQPVSAPPPSLIVLNNDAIVCDACYEPQALELDPGRIQWACIASGECSRCGAGTAVPPPGARATS